MPSNLEGKRIAIPYKSQILFLFQMNMMRSTALIYLVEISLPKTTNKYKLPLYL